MDVVCHLPKLFQCPRNCQPKILREQNLSKSIYLRSKKCNSGYIDLGSNLDSVPLRCKSDGFPKRKEMLIYIVYEEFLIDIGGRKLILAKSNWLPRLSLSKVFTVASCRCSGWVLGIFVFWPSSKVHGSTSENMQMAHLLVASWIHLKTPWCELLHFILPFTELWTKYIELIL